MSAGWACIQSLGDNTMALKYQLDSLDGVDESVKTLYTEKDGKFVLGIEGLPQQEDVSGLKAKVDELLNEKKEATRKAKEAEDAAAKAAEEAARKGGDTEALDKSWQEKYNKREQELQAQIDGLNGSVTNMTVDSVALQMASDLAVEGSAKVLLPHIKARLAVEQKDGKYVTAVRDAEGKPSASTLDDLKNEISSDPAFAHVVVGSKASGGGANGSKKGGGGAVTGSFGGSREERQAAIGQKFPELNK
tara:strand:- start:25145 stop:25888 length:744 start_codon:yes stop_codon:yes gene_type:complete